MTAQADVSGIEIGRRIVTYALLCPPIGREPPLLPIFFFTLMQSLLASIDGQPPAEQAIAIELLVLIIASSLTGLLQMEWALRSLDSEMRHPVGQPSVTVARRLASDLKRSHSYTATKIMQRLSSSPSFVANFPTMVS